MKKYEKEIIQYKSWQSIIIYFLLWLILPIIMGMFYTIISDTNEINEFPTWFNLYTQTAVCILGLIIIVWKMHGKLLKDKLDENMNYGLIAIITTFIISIGIIWDIVFPTSANQLELEKLLDSSILLSGFFIVIASPLIEELIFRYNFKELIKNSILFILLSSLLYGFMHGFSFTPEAIIYYMIGAILAIAYVKTNNILSCITIHFLNNLFWFIVMLIRL